MLLQRRSFLAVSGSLLAGLAGCIAGGNDEDNENGTENAGDANGDGQEDGPGSFELVEPRWIHETGGSLSTVAGGVLYGRESITNGSGGIFALDAATGERDWVYGETGGYSVYTPPVLADSIYFGLGDDAIGSGNGELYALNRDGEERWVETTGSIYEPPVLTQDGLYVGSDDGRVYRFHVEPGEVLWSRRVDGGEESPAEPTVEAVENGVVYVSRDDHVVGLDATDGRERWIVRPDDKRVLSVQVADDAYVATRGVVAAFDDGELRWTNEAMGGSIEAVRDGTVYATDWSRLVALDTDGGEQHWEVTTDQRHTLHVGSAQLYLGTTELRALDWAGETRWRTQLDAGEINSLTPAEDGVYVSTETGVYRVNAGGDVLAGAEIGSVGETVVGEDVYAATDEQIVAVDL